MDFDKQNIILKNQYFKVSIGYLRLEDETLSIGCEELKTAARYEVSFKVGSGFYLLARSKDDPAQSVKITRDRLILALSQELVCFKLPELTVEWNLDLDKMPVFEFIDIEDDILLRGELQIFRINMNGKIVWSTYGEDIWVNIHGEREMQLIDKQIVLTDFNGKKYYIDIANTRA